MYHNCHWWICNGQKHNHVKPGTTNKSYNISGITSHVHTCIPAECSRVRYPIYIYTPVRLWQHTHMMMSQIISVGLEESIRVAAPIMPFYVTLDNCTVSTMLCSLKY